jgi:uncharacterized metal-binding protein
VKDGNSCCDGSSEVLVFTCAGAACSGQVANRAGVELAKDQKGDLFCIAAIAADRPDMMERARKVATRIAIDGCEDHCCLRILQAAALEADLHVVVTDLSIEKRPERPSMLVDTGRVVDGVLDHLGRKQETAE